mmetsp:Transcript_10268/g.31399  ORF Transcript_10268/g.31399 Transcript_10268/m.31399 type:complete len:130 (-) Transcript_10268:1300-1689(-)
MAARWMLLAAFVLAIMMCARAQEDAAVEGVAGSDDEKKKSYGEDVPAGGEDVPEGGEDISAGGEDSTTETSETQKKIMMPPEIEAGGLTALLVGGLLLAILLPGMLCLYNIQTPQKFEVPEKDTKNKTQ